MKMRGLLHAPFAFKIFSQPVPTRPGTQTFWQVPDPSPLEVKNPYLSDPAPDTLSLLLFRSHPIHENELSACVLVPGTHRYFLASLDNVRYSFFLAHHKSREIR